MVNDGVLLEHLLTKEKSMFKKSSEGVSGGCILVPVTQGRLFYVRIYDSRQESEVYAYAV